MAQKLNPIQESMSVYEKMIASEAQSPRSKALQSPSFFAGSRELRVGLDWNFCTNEKTFLNTEELLEDFLGDLDQLRSYLINTGSYLMSNYETAYQAVICSDHVTAKSALLRMRAMAVSLRTCRLTQEIDDVIGVFSSKKLESALGFMETLRVSIQETNRQFLKLHSCVYHSAV